MNNRNQKSDKSGKSKKSGNQNPISKAPASTDGIRINKYLAQAGICSRRDADVLIAAKEVCINGRIAGNGDRVFLQDEVTCRGKVVGNRQDVAVLAYYKPVGVVCSERDRHADRLLSDQIHFPVRVTYAGRLDKDSEGLLLLTNDGALIDHLMRGANRHEKEYVVRVKQDITDDFIRKMEAGVYLKELDQKTRPCRLEQIGKNTFRIILTQGLNRQIRRMCAAFHYDVTSLKRVRVANVTIGKLRPGEYRMIENEELEMLYEIAKGKAK